jgi:hypothetical protein
VPADKRDKIPFVSAHKKQHSIMKSPLTTCLLQTNTYEDKAIPYDQ